MKIEIANIEDVPEILNLQYLTETVEHACGEFPKYTTLKMLSDGGKIIGAGRVTKYLRK